MVKIKKIILGFLLLGITATADVLELKVGVDINGKYHTDNNGSAKAKFGASEIGVEYRKEFIENDSLEVGIGAAFQYHERVKNGNDITNSMPVYLTAKYYFVNNLGTGGWISLGRAGIYAKADVGYSFNNDIDNGMYYAAGVGVNLFGLDSSLMYKRNNGKVSGYKVDYDRVTLNIGIPLGKF